jgi:hypothetical protein
LIEDLPRFEVSSRGHLRGSAKGTPHDAADLRGEAYRHATLLFEGDEDRFDKHPIVGLKKEFFETIDS